MGEGSRGPRPHGSRWPQTKTTVNWDRRTLLDLYHNPDPLIRLIGELNETSVVIENVKVKGLVDLGAQILSISDKFAKLLKLPINKLETLLDQNPREGEVYLMKGMWRFRCRFQA